MRLYRPKFLIDFERCALTKRYHPFMDAFNEKKLKDVGNQMIDHLIAQLALLVATQDGWSLTVTVPEIKIRMELHAPSDKG